MIFKAFITVLLFSYTALMATDDGEVSKEVVVSSSKRLKLGHEDEAEPVKNAGVTKLDLSDNRYLKNIDFIVHFPALQRLTLEDCSQLKDSYHPVSHLTNLVSLTLNNVKLTTLTHLQELVSLTSLDVSNNAMLTVKGIERLPRLKKLRLAGNTYLEDLTDVGKITTLERLNLDGVFIERQHDDIELVSSDLGFLISLVNLEVLGLAYNDRIRHIAPLAMLLRLRKLDLSFTRIEDWPILVSVISLKQLDIRDAHLEDTSILSSLLKLRKLVVHKHKKLPPLSHKITIIRR